MGLIKRFLKYFVEKIIHVEMPGGIFKRSKKYWMKKAEKK
jgi:hypothetical protein